jgi:phage tail-like protein
MPFDTRDPFVNYAFSIEIGGIDFGHFTELSGVTSEVDVVEYHANDKKGSWHISKAPGKRKPATITLKRGMDKSKKLYDWHKQIYDGKLDGQRKDISIVLYDYSTPGVPQEQSRFNAFNAWPSKVTMSGLKAGANEVVTEEVTIQTEKLERKS